MCTRYTIPKMTILTKCVYVAAAARTGAFHHAVKHQTLVASRSAYHLRLPEVWYLTARAVEVSAARIALPHIK